MNSRLLWATKNLLQEKFLKVMFILCDGYFVCMYISVPCTYGCWEPNPGPLQEQPVRLTASSLSSPLPKTPII